MDLEINNINGGDVGGMVDMDKEWEIWIEWWIWMGVGLAIWIWGGVVDMNAGGSMARAEGIWHIFLNEGVGKKGRVGLEMGDAYTLPNVLSSLVE